MSRSKPVLDEQQLAERHLLRAAGALAFVGAAILLFGMASPVLATLGVVVLGLGIWLGFWVGINS